MQKLATGAIVMLGLALALDAYGYDQSAAVSNYATSDYAANATADYATNTGDAAMTPDSGTTGVGTEDPKSE